MDLITTGTKITTPKETAQALRAGVLQSKTSNAEEVDDFGAGQNRVVS
ncbi:MAG: hypothetical protein QG607_213 [Patescibacteria group bacterium]|nr:hypothetical protein [Patescibacteria group bacterium]